MPGAHKKPSRFRWIDSDEDVPACLVSYRGQYLIVNPSSQVEPVFSEGMELSRWSEAGAIPPRGLGAYR